MLPAAMTKRNTGVSFPERRRDSHKGTYGRLLVIAGSEGMSGAAYFNAAAAYRTGAGLVEIYTSGANRIVLQSLLPEAIVTTYDSYEEEKLRELLDKADAVCIGSGLGTGKKQKDSANRSSGIKSAMCH